MCKNLILLARNDHNQMIFTCEHGTIHITHQHTTLCMGSTAFMKFAHLIVHGNLATLNQSENWNVREAGSEHMELWIDNGGLRLTVTQFFALSDLIRLTLQRLHDFQTANRRPAPRRGFSWN